MEDQDQDQRRDQDPTTTVVEDLRDDLTKTVDAVGQLTLTEVAVELDQLFQDILPAYALHCTLPVDRSYRIRALSARLRELAAAK